MKKVGLDSVKIRNLVGDYASPYLAILNNFDSDLLVIPSFVDVHVHLREPGFFYKETIETGTKAAARGGYSTVFSMPNLMPVPDTLENLKLQLDIIEKKAVIEVIPYGAITMCEKGETLAKMEEMAQYVVGFSDDGVGVEAEGLMRQAMIKAKSLGKIIAAHCEDMNLRAGGYIHDGEYAKIHNHKGISSESEWRQIERDLKLVEETGCSYHVCHLSTKEGVELIRQAKARGLDVSCETAPHYLVLCDMDLQEDGRFKMNPPIRGEDDRAALIEGIKDGTIDIIATDHAPHTAEEKGKGLASSAMGIVGLETAFPVLYTELVLPGVISLEKLVELMSTNPRKRFGLKGAEDAGDFSVWDVFAEYEVNPDEFQTMGRSTPFEGRKVFGKCLLNVKNGKVVYEREEK